MAFFSKFAICWVFRCCFLRIWACTLQRSLFGGKYKGGTERKKNREVIISLGGSQGGSQSRAPNSTLVTYFISCCSCLCLLCWPVNPCFRQFSVCSSKNPTLTTSQPTAQNNNKQSPLSPDSKKHPRTAQQQHQNPLADLQSEDSCCCPASWGWVQLLSNIQSNPPAAEPKKKSCEPARFNILFLPNWDNPRATQRKQWEQSWCQVWSWSHP